MSTPPRNLPRFLPTLTEVVQPSGLAGTSASAAPDMEEIVQSVMQRVALTTERRLREETEAMVRALVNEQVQALSERRRQELESVVRQAVADALRLGTDPYKIN